MGTVTRDACNACHKTQIVNQDGYCDDCQGKIDWFFSKGKNIIKKEVPPFWQVSFFFIFILIIAIVIGFGMGLF